MHDFFRDRKGDLLQTIDEKLALDKDLEEKLGAALKEFKSYYKP